MVKKNIALRNNFKYKVIVVIVTYFPEREKLEELVNSLYFQVEKIIIIDNTEKANTFIEFKYKNDKKLILICLGENLGIAKAQNIGIKEALRYGADFILLSDQDTLFPSNFIKKMLSAYEELTASHRIGAIGPIFWDKTKEELSVILEETFFSLRKVIPTKRFHFPSYIIASGKLIPRNALVDVGLMKEELFIDWVDVEWCWRAKNKGYKIVCTSDVRIDHSLGDKTINFLGKKRTIRSYIRHYYMVRNATFLLLYEKSLKFNQKLYLLSRIIRWVIGFPLVSKPHLLNLKFCIKGILDGTRKRLYKYENR